MFHFVEKKQMGKNKVRNYVLKGTNKPATPSPLEYVNNGKNYKYIVMDFQQKENRREYTDFSQLCERTIYAIKFLKIIIRKEKYEKRKLNIAYIQNYYLLLFIVLYSF